MPITGVPAARARLARFAQGLRAAAGGEVVRRAAVQVGALVRKVAQDRLSKHSASGAALGETTVDVEGGLVLLHGMPAARGKQWGASSYVGMHRWWPFRGKRMPPFVLKAAAVILARELLLALGGKVGPLGIEAGALVEEADAAEEKRRQKAALRAARKAARRGRH